MRSGYRLGRVAGTQVFADWSWAFIALLLTWNLTVVFSSWHPTWALGTSIAVAVAAMMLFFASVIAHELAHALVGSAQGIPVRHITLWLFGGVTNTAKEPPSPRAEFLTALVGPLTSLALGGIFMALSGVAVGHTSRMVDAPRDAFASLGPASTLLFWLGPVNIMLGIFNMVPAFPLDGGRMLRSALWAATGDLRRSTRWASGVSRLIAWGFIVVGFAMVFGARVPFLGTGVISGLWLAFIGWFLNGAAVLTRQQVDVDDLLGDVPVRHLMRKTGTFVPPDLAVSRFVHEWLLRNDERAYPVLQGERFLGMVCLADVRKVARDAWAGTAVADVMTPARDLVLTTPDEHVSVALSHLARRDVAQLPVVSEDRLVGMLLLRDIMRWIELQSGNDPGRGASPPAPYHPVAQPGLAG